MGVCGDTLKTILSHNHFGPCIRIQEPNVWTYLARPAPMIFLFIELVSVLAVMACGAPGVLHKSHRGEGKKTSGKHTKHEVLMLSLSFSSGPKALQRRPADVPFVMCRRIANTLIQTDARRVSKNCHCLVP